MKKIYLASASPRRLQLLKQIGIQPEVVVADFNENMGGKLTPKQIVIDNAVGKAKAASQNISTKNSLIIAADTIVVYQNRILGKPTCRKNAYETLKVLSGKQHSVLTGVCVIDKSTSQHLAAAVETLVEMREINHNEIEAYLNTDEPYDKAGAYGIQCLAGVFVKSITGSYSNVVGLPVETVGEMLKKFNFEVFSQWHQKK